MTFDDVNKQLDKVLKTVIDCQNCALEANIYAQIASEKALEAEEEAFKAREIHEKLLRKKLLFYDGALK